MSIRLVPFLVLLVTGTAFASETRSDRIRSVKVDLVEQDGERAVTREQLVLSLRGDGGSSKIEARSGDFSTSVGARVDPQGGDALVVELTIWRVLNSSIKSRTVFNYVGRVALTLGKRTVVARHVGPDRRALETAVTAE